MICLLTIIIHCITQDIQLSACNFYDQEAFKASVAKSLSKKFSSLKWNHKRLIDYVFLLLKQNPYSRVANNILNKTAYFQ